LPHERSDLSRSLPSLERLIADLRHLANGGEIDPAVLTAAPLLASWAVGATWVPERILVGRVTGHPLIPDGPCRTSRLFAISPDGGYARTFSRWYRLGTPARPNGGAYDA
jgi:hypothetical protein